MHYSRIFVPGSVCLRIVLLMQPLAELAPAVAVHPGPVLIDAICDISGSIDVIVGDKKIPVECLGKEHQ